jgi:fructose-1,6-bisphosphatase/inositol monophosphatase family enzyme
MVAKGRGQVRWINADASHVLDIVAAIVTLELHNFQCTTLSRHEPSHCETLPRWPLSSARNVAHETPAP